MSINLGSSLLSASGYTYNSEVIDPNIVTNGLIAWYDAGNYSSAPGTGTTYYNCGYGCQYYSSDPGCDPCNEEWMDMSGYGNNLTRNGSGSNYFDYTDNGGVLEFPGNSFDIMASVASDSIASTDNALTVTGWIKTDSWVNGNIFSQNYNSGWRARVATTTGELWFYVSGNFVSGGEVPIGQWTHICCTGDASGLAVYVNNELADSNATAYSPTSTGAPIFLGAYNTTNEIFNGQMATMQFYNRRLSHAERLQNYNADRQRFDESDLIEPSVTPTPSITPTVTPTASPTRTPTPTPTSSPAASPAPTPSNSPTLVAIDVYALSGCDLSITQLRVNGVVTTGGSFPVAPGNSTTTYTNQTGTQNALLYLNGVPSGNESMYWLHAGGNDCFDIYDSPETASITFNIGQACAVQYQNTKC